MTLPGWRRFVPALVAVGVVAVVVVVTVLISGAVAGSRRPDPGDAPTVTRTYFAENAGPKATGRVCSLVVASSAGAVAVGLDCGSLPAESRIADLLEGAGQ